MTVEFDLLSNDYTVNESIKREVIHIINQERKSNNISIKESCNIKIFSNDFKLSDVEEISKKTLSNISVEQNNGKEYSFYLIINSDKKMYKFNLLIN